MKLLVWRQKELNKLKRHKFKELRFYVVFFTIYIVLNNLMAYQIWHQGTAESETLPETSLFMITGTQVALFFAVIFAAKRGGNSLKGIGFGTSSWWKGCLVGLGIMAFWLLVSPWLYRFLVVVLHLPDIPIAESPFSPLWVITSIIIAIGEETVWRGYGYNILNKYVKRPWIFALVGIFLFALILNSVFIWRKNSSSRRCGSCKMWCTCGAYLIINGLYKIWKDAEQLHISSVEWI